MRKEAAVQMSLSQEPHVQQAELALQISHMPEKRLVQTDIKKKVRAEHLISAAANEMRQERHVKKWV